MKTSVNTGECKVQTANLDGEITLKTKSSLAVALELFEEDSYRGTSELTVICNMPNANLNYFSGSFLLGTDRFWVESKNLLLRGCNLKHTEYVIGMVIYPGKYSKIMMNRKQAQFKRSTYEHIMNQIVVIELCIQTIMCFFLAVSAAFFASSSSASQYLYQGYELSPGAIGGFTYATFFLLLNTLIPISLVISLELIKFLQFIFIELDVKLYDSSQDQPAKVQSFNITEELGQVDYIFSDKTGTLTSNCMEFKGCSIGNKIYGDPFNSSIMKTEQNPQEACSESKVSVDYEIEGEPRHIEYTPTPRGHFSESAVYRNSKPSVYWNFDQSELRSDIVVSEKSLDIDLDELLTNQTELITEFLLCIVMCNDVIAEYTEEYTEIKYFGASPDEVTLVDAAKQLGVVFLERNSERIVCSVHGEIKHFKILAINEFTAERKMMSVAIENPDTHNIILYIKGADSAIDLILDYEKEQLYLGNSKAAASTFAERGLRTLYIGCKSIKHSDFADWYELYKAAKCSSSEAQKEHLEQLATEIEDKITLIGVTALEDKLQDKVPETVSALTEAEIKI